MQPQFWYERWMEDRIGFHQETINSQLEACWPRSADQRILVPLCGKSLDLRFLADFGSVVGVELSKIAIRDFFSEWDTAPLVSSVEGTSSSTANNVTLLEANFFDVPSSFAANFTHAYDRAAMIALPPEMQMDYVRKLSELLQSSGQVLCITIEYPEDELSGPPFSIGVDAMSARASPYFDIECLSSENTWRPDSRLADEGLTELITHVFRLTKK